MAVSRQGEPEAVLRYQLACLHAQIVCILTNGFERMFQRNPGFDSRRLLGKEPYQSMRFRSKQVGQNQLNQSPVNMSLFESNSRKEQKMIQISVKVRQKLHKLAAYSVF